jgi:hypothetical protein
MTINYTKLKRKLVPEPDGQDVLRLRTGTIAAIAADGTVTVTLSGVAVVGISVLGGSAFAVGTVVQILSYRGSLLVIGAAGGQSAQAVKRNSTDNGNGTVATATGFTNTVGGTSTSPLIFGVSFIAPPSGEVFVVARALAGTATAAGYVFLDFEVKTGATVGSGTIVRAGGDLTASVFQSSTASQQGTLITDDVVTGLTPGAAYNATLIYRSSAGTGSFNRRHIAVLPQ